MTTISPRNRLRNRWIYFILILLVAVALMSPPRALAHGEGEELFHGAEKLIMPATDTPPRVDGAIDQGEYNAYGEWEEEAAGFTVFLTHNGSWLFVGARQTGSGWIGIAFSTDVDEGANVVTAVVNASGAVIRDNFAANVTDEMTMEPDVSVGGTSDILAFTATSSATGEAYEFAIPLASEDTYDQRFEPGVIYPLVVAFNTTAQDLPLALNEGDTHFLSVYVARPSDDLAAIQTLFEASPSSIPPLVAMAVLTAGAGAVLWRFGAPRRGEA